MCAATVNNAALDLVYGPDRPGNTARHKHAGEHIMQVGTGADHIANDYNQGQHYNGTAKAWGKSIVKFAMNLVGEIMDSATYFTDGEPFEGGNYNLNYVTQK